MKRLSLVEFVKRSRIIHGNKYDYARSVYVNTRVKIEIICPMHGSFFQPPTDHLSGHGCLVCGGTNRSTANDFIRNATVIHGDEYDYSMVKYSNAFSKIKIICHKHGEFLQKPNSHLNGCGCPMCYGTPKKTTQEFIECANKRHKDFYDYSKSVYITSKQKLEIICPKHGSFRQCPITHLRGVGCPACANNISHTNNSFIAQSNIVHGNRYDYSKVNYNGNKKYVIIICHKHGEFLQKPNGHLYGNGCPRCNISLGELKIFNFLKSNNIEYIFQKTFADCRNPKTNQMLKFDFYISSHNLLVEYDGKQHFNICNIKGKYQMDDEDLKGIRMRDRLKTKYAKKNNITLLRIKYTKFNKIEEILKSYLIQ